MGYEKIQAKRKELEKKIEVRGQFVKEAEAINRGLAQIQRAYKDLENLRQMAMKRVDVMDTLGVPEFEAHQKALMELLDAPEDLKDVKVLSTDKIDQVIKRGETELNMMVQAYEDKLTASFPPQVLPGMSFKDPATKRIYQIIKQRENPMPGKQTTREALNAYYKRQQDPNFQCKSLDHNGKEDNNQTAFLSQLKKWKYMKI